MKFGVGKYRRFNGCKYYERCQDCELSVCLFMEHNEESCDVPGGEGKFFPDVPKGMKIRPEFDSEDLKLVVRAFDSYICYGIATVNGDADKIVALFVSMTKKVDYSKGKKVGSNPGINGCYKLVLENRESEVNKSSHLSSALKLFGKIED